MDSADLIGEVESRLGILALEMHWRPCDVWALTLREFCLFADIADRIVDTRKKQQRSTRGGRGRRRGR